MISTAVEPVEDCLRSAAGSNRREQSVVALAFAVPLRIAESPDGCAPAGARVPTSMRARSSAGRLRRYLDSGSGIRNHIPIRRLPEPVTKLVGKRLQQPQVGRTCPHKRRADGGKVHPEDGFPVKSGRQPGPRSNHPTIPFRAPLETRNPAPRSRCGT